MSADKVMELLFPPGDPGLSLHLTIRVGTRMVVQTSVTAPLTMGTVTAIEKGPPHTIVLRLDDGDEVRIVI